MSCFRDNPFLFRVLHNLTCNRKVEKIGAVENKLIDAKNADTLSRERYNRDVSSYFEALAQRADII